MAEFDNETLTTIEHNIKTYNYNFQSMHDTTLLVIASHRAVSKRLAEAEHALMLCLRRESQRKD